MTDVANSDTLTTVDETDSATSLAHVGGQGRLHMLTTIDNPFNPFTEYDKWSDYDEGAGYYTAQFLARIAITSDELSEADQDIAIENAIEEIVKENVLGIYRKVTEESFGD